MYEIYPTRFLTDPGPSFDLISDVWFPRFSDTARFEELYDEEKECAEQILLDLTGFILYYQNCIPEAWSFSHIEHCLLIDFPRSLSRSKEYECCIHTVFCTFFAFLNEENLISDAEKIICSLPSIEDEFFEAIEDVNLYSTRKALIVSAMDDGIDVNDSDALDDYLLDIAHREMEGIDPDIYEKINEVMKSWVFPFSDSRYLAAIHEADGDDLVLIISLLLGSLTVEEGIPPLEWDKDSILHAIQTMLIPYPFKKRTRETCIPILRAFFTYLGDEHLQPHAHEIADFILPLHEEMISYTPNPDNEVEFFFAQSVLESGVDINEEAIGEFLDENKEALILDYISSKGPGAFDVLLKNSGFNPQVIDSPRKTVELSSIPKANREWFITITDMIDTFCDERLDDEYADICRYVAGKLARKRDCQVSRGKITIWASGIIYAVGQINFLFDKSFEPYQSASDICKYFGTSKSTVSQKAQMIRDLIGMGGHWDPEYSTSRMMKKNPFERFLMSGSGLIFK
ncbi:DUF6398 domain-containing protein [Methanospirillum stamsii]|uniref:DUF6398 domain-containing protein n=1 Tax=Methanospirillum stamsii TaxID=1277351 RepID=A0A2V2N6T1_9EURY|nr:DUF6398 domain-containing protein [Methanospirillum stamsii]PWR73436.1 hypothetical protein DLD82_09285 [Methanospirillum stamsii]